MQASTISKLSVDCVVIGGGPGGLWALDAITQRKNLSCLLLEKHRLGSDQAEHAEWFLHRGAVFRAMEKHKAPYVARLKEGVVGWNRLVETPAQSHCVGAHGTIFWLDDKKVLWSEWCDTTDELDELDDIKKLAPIGAATADPDLIRWSRYSGNEQAFATREQSARQAPLLAQLKSQHQSRLLPYSAFEVKNQPNSNRVHSLILDQQIEIETGAVVVASGSYNDRILRDSFDCNPPSGIDSHHSTLDGLILSLLDPTCTLQLVNSFTVKNELMVVCRKCPKGHHWLVSGAGSWGTPNEPLFGPEKPANWVPTVWQFLLNQFPVLGDLKQQMTYRIVKGGLVQPAFRKDTSGVSNVYSPTSLTNLVAVFPQRLSCSPAFGNDVAERVETILMASKWVKCPQPADLPVNDVEIAVSSYEKEPGNRLSWTDFRSKYQLPD